MKNTKIFKFFLFIFFINLVIISCDYQSDNKITEGNFILFPNKGETLIQGDTCIIKWIDNVSSTVRIKLTIYNTNIISIADSIANTGEFSWIVPDTLIAYDCSIKILSNNSDFISFESERTFRILGSNDTSSFIDTRDGQVYKTVKINDQWWMAENLNFDTIGSYCYLNDNSYCNEFGRLYTISAANNCAPSGWHLPSDAEWRQMEEYLGVQNEDIFSAGSRGANMEYLLSSNTKIGFNAKFSGYMTHRYYSRFYSIYSDTYFWTSSVNITKTGYFIRHLSKSIAGIERTSTTSTYNAYSVRYVKDSE